MIFYCEIPNYPNIHTFTHHNIESQAVDNKMFQYERYPRPKLYVPYSVSSTSKIQFHFYVYMYTVCCNRKK